MNLLAGHLAWIYASAGDANRALPPISHLLQTDYVYPLTPDLPRIEPAWDPIRKDPCFEALLQDGGHDRD